MQLTIEQCREQFLATEVSSGELTLFTSPLLAEEPETRSGLTLMMGMPDEEWLKYIGTPAGSSRIKYKGVLPSGVSVIGKETTVGTDDFEDMIWEMTFAHFLREPIQRARDMIDFGNLAPEGVNLSLGSEKPLGLSYRPADGRVLSFFEWIDNAIDGHRIWNTRDNTILNDYTSYFLRNIIWTTSVGLKPIIDSLGVMWPDLRSQQTMVQTAPGFITVNLIDFESCKPTL